MKKYILACVVLCLTGMAVAAGNKPAAKSIPSLTFNGKKYYLQYSVGNSKEWLNEYLPAGANFDSYTEMLTVRSYDSLKGVPPEQVAASIGGNYARNYPGAPYNVVKGTNPGEWEVSFAIRTDKMAEFDLFRIVSVGEHPVALQYVNRVLLSGSEQNQEKQLQQFAAGIQNNLNTSWTVGLRKMPVPPMVRTIKQ